MSHQSDVALRILDFWWRAFGCSTHCTWFTLKWTVWVKSFDSNRLVPILQTILSDHSDNCPKVHWNRSTMLIVCTWYSTWYGTLKRVHQIATLWDPPVRGCCNEIREVILLSHVLLLCTSCTYLFLTSLNLFTILFYSIWLFPMSDCLIVLSDLLRSLTQKLPPDRRETLRAHLAMLL